MKCGLRNKYKKSSCAEIESYRCIYKDIGVDKIIKKEVYEFFLKTKGLHESVNE